MPPKVKFSREQVVDAAFEVARTEGIDNITIRKVAEKLGSSIAPIYVNFNDIDELKRAVVQKIFAISEQLVKDQEGEDPFLAIGIASLRFAREYSLLYRDLVMNSNDYMKDYEPTMRAIIEQMQKDPELGVFSEEELMLIIFKMRVFQLGLSVMEANGLLPDEFTEERLIEILKNTGEDVVVAARMRKDGILS